jgi:hypothetical protein
MFQQISHFISAFGLTCMLLFMASCDGASSGDVPLINNPQIAPPPPVAEAFCPQNVDVFWTDLDSAAQTAQFQHPSVNAVLLAIFLGEESFVAGKHDSLASVLANANLCQAPFYAELIVRVLEGELPIYDIDETTKLDAATAGGSSLVGLGLNNPEYFVNMLNHSERYWQPMLRGMVAHLTDAYPGFSHLSDRFDYYGTVNDFDAHVRRKVTFASEEEAEKWDKFVQEVRVGVSMASEGF